MITSILSQFRSGHERSGKTKKNIFFLILIKSVSILISLLLVNIAVHYVDKERYGIWLTVSSIVVWASFFDIGLSNGMRNKWVEAKARGDIFAAKVYVSTTFFSLVSIFSILGLVFIFINQFVDWCAVLKISETNASDVRLLIGIVFIYFCIQFVLKTINVILTADQQPAKASLIDTLGQVFALLVVFVLVQLTDGSLVRLGLGLTMAPLIILIIANILLFSGNYKFCSPDWRFFKWDYLKDIFGLSIKFFVIQIAALIQYQTANFIIARSFSMASVTDYNITYKYFHILMMGFTIFLTPFWSASTEAFVKKDFSWITLMVKRYNLLLLLFVGAGMLMLLISSFAYDLWIGKNIVSIPFALSLCCLLYMLTSMFGAIYVQLLNGIGAVKIQYYTSLITPVLFILLCWFFSKGLHLGIYSIFIASILSNLNGIVLAPLQYRKIFIEKKEGIWKA